MPPKKLKRDQRVKLKSPQQQSAFHSQSSINCIQCQLLWSIWDSTRKHSKEVQRKSIGNGFGIFLPTISSPCSNFPFQEGIHSEHWYFHHFLYYQSQCDMMDTLHLFTLTLSFPHRKYQIPPFPPLLQCPHCKTGSISIQKLIKLKFNCCYRATHFTQGDT